MPKSKNKTKSSNKKIVQRKTNVESKMVEPTKSALEKHIDDVSKQVEIPLEKHETTPGVGNCWYEACASLMKLNNMRNITAKQLRKEVVDNIENCENFANVFEITFESNYIKLAAFKKKHHREGEFTDEDGVIALATGFYLGVTLRIFSSSNTKRQPYTEHNANQPIIFNIFLDDRTTNSEHFQSLRQPEVKLPGKDQIKDSEPKDSKTNRSSGEVWVDYIDRFHNEESK